MVSGGGAKIPIPALYRVFFNKTVAAEQLDTVGSDLHALLIAQKAGQAAFPVVASADFGPTGGAPGEHAHTVGLNGHIADHESHRLPVADGLAKGLAVVAVRNDIIQHRLCCTYSQAAAHQGSPVDKGLKAKVIVAEQRVCR